jgi:hypothetical protein
MMERMKGIFLERAKKTPSFVKNMVGLLYEAVERKAI